ncbi:MAG: thiamine pyrophosphate-dependent enzyme [Candidatus Kapaibacterium sp.]
MLQQLTTALQFNRENFDGFSLQEIYRRLLLPRMIEEKMLLLLRQGRISKWFSGIGQEGISVGATLALGANDWILPLHRNLGVFTTRDFPLGKLFAQWQGKADGYTKGRDRSFHFGAPEHRVVGMISHLGSMLGVADGISLAGKLIGDDAIALAFIGDGGTSQGDFHEAVNLAACWDLPVIFMIENNGYALSTPVREQFRCAQLADRAIGYGIEGVTIDGNNVLEVYETIRRAAAVARAEKRPIIVEAMTFRRRGHEEASGVAYVPKELIEEWEKVDPVATFESWLLEEGVLDQSLITTIREIHKRDIEEGVEHMMSAPEPIPQVVTEVRDVYAPSPPIWNTLPTESGPELRLVDAISEGLRQGMEQDSSLVIMGQDVAAYGGVFKVTEGFVERFGTERVRNTPLCEAAVLGAGLGLAVRGIPSVIEMQFADFVSEGFNQIVNNLAKTHYRWGTPVNVTVRMPTGGGVAAGPFHSQSDEAWFSHVPGLKVLFPSNPYDAKGLIAAALREPNPVMFFEHKYLYRSARGPVPEEYYTLPIGSARVVRSGSGGTIITWGTGISWGMEVAESLPDYDLEVIDLRSILPWDRETVFTSVRKTGRALILHEATLTGGFGGEIAAVIGEELFGELDAPVMRCASLDTPVPFNKGLEDQFMAKSRLRDVVEKMVKY